MQDRKQIEYKQKKIKILNTSRQMFSEKGVEQVSVREIISAVGIAKGAFYIYYESKSELLQIILVQLLDKLADEIKWTTSDILDKPAVGRLRQTLGQDLQLLCYLSLHAQSERVKAKLDELYVELGENRFKQVLGLIIF